MIRAPYTIGYEGATLRAFVRTLAQRKIHVLYDIREQGVAELAEPARWWAIQLGAEQHGADSEVESERLGAVFTYEEVVSTKRGGRSRASHTWQIFDRSNVA